MNKMIQHFLFLSHDWVHYEEGNKDMRMCSICGISEELQWTEEGWKWTPLGGIAWKSN